MAGISGIKP